MLIPHEHIRKKGFWLAVACICLLLSCTKVLELPKTGKNSKIVLQGELVADSIMYLRASQTLSLTTTGANFVLPTGLRVFITDDQGQEYELSSSLDSLSQLLYSIPFKHAQNVKAGASYTIRALHPQMDTVSASVYVPRTLTATVGDTATVIYGADTALRLTLTIEDAGAETNFYVIEAVKQPRWATARPGADTAKIPLYDTFYANTYIRQRLYTDDEFAENSIKGSFSTLSRRVFYKDRAFNGGVLKTQIFVPKYQFTTTDRSDKGVLIISVKSVSEEYYAFLKAYEQYEPIAGFNTGNAPVKIEGNVANGFGMIGGVSQKKYQYLIDTLVE